MPAASWLWNMDANELKWPPTWQNTGAPAKKNLPRIGFLGLCRVDQFMRKLPASGLILLVSGFISVLVSCSRRAIPGTGPRHLHYLSCWMQRLICPFSCLYRLVFYRRNISLTEYVWQRETVWKNLSSQQCLEDEDLGILPQLPAQVGSILCWSKWALGWWLEADKIEVLRGEENG